MTHPQDPEQQAVAAWMEGMGFKWSERLWFYVRPDDSTDPLTNETQVSHKTATFFYRTHQAQVAVARAEGVEYVLRVLRSEEGRLRQIANTVFYSAEYLAELRGLPAPDLENFGSYKDYLARLKDPSEVAQLNPQKPKGEPNG